MPQLDTNTFIYQYFSIIVVLLIVYVLLGYLILPIVFRTILIRTKWVVQSSFITFDISSKLSLPNEASLLQVTRVNYAQIFNSRVFNTIFSAVPAATTPLIQTTIKNNVVIKSLKLTYTNYLALYLAALELKEVR